MFKTVPYAKEYEMSVEGQIRRKDGKECIFTTINREPAIELLMYGVNKTVPLEWLRLVTHFEVDLPIQQFWNLSFVPTHDWKYANSVRRLMIFINKYITYKEIYRIVPNYTRYAVSADGVLIDRKTDTVVEPSSGSDYLKVFVYNPDKGKFVDTVLHRLVALAWVRNPDPERYYIVNHIDGNKQNPKSDNLEWVSYSENNAHAYQTGLKFTIACKVRNVEIKTITEYVSMRDASDYMGIGASQFTHHMTKWPDKLIKGVYEVKLGNDTTSWVHDVVDKRVGTETVKYTLTDSLGNVEYVYGKPKLTERLNIGSLRYHTDEMLCDAAKRLGYTLDIENLDDRVKKIQSYNLLTKQITTHDSVRGAVRDLGIGRKVIVIALAKDNETYTSNGYAFRYYTKRKWNTAFKQYSNKSACIQAIHKDGQSTVCASIRDAIKLTGVNGKAIARSLRGTPISFDWGFKYA